MIARTENTIAPTFPQDNTGTNNDDDLSPWKIFDNIVATNTAPGTPLSRAIKDMYLSHELLPRTRPDGKFDMPSGMLEKPPVCVPQFKKDLRHAM